MKDLCYESDFTPQDLKKAMTYNAYFRMRFTVPLLILIVLIGIVGLISALPGLPHLFCGVHRQKNQCCGKGSQTAEKCAPADFIVRRTGGLCKKRKIRSLRVGECGFRQRIQRIFLPLSGIGTRIGTAQAGCFQRYRTGNQKLADRQAASGKSAFAQRYDLSYIKQNQTHQKSAVFHGAFLYDLYYTNCIISFCGRTTERRGWDAGRRQSVRVH